RVLFRSRERLLRPARQVAEEVGVPLRVYVIPRVLREAAERLGRLLLVRVLEEPRHLDAVWTLWRRERALLPDRCRLEQRALREQVIDGLRARHVAQREVQPDRVGERGAQAPTFVLRRAHDRGDRVFELLEERADASFRIERLTDQFLVPAERGDVQHVLDELDTLRRRLLPGQEPRGLLLRDDAIVAEQLEELATLARAEVLAQRGVRVERLGEVIQRPPRLPHPPRAARGLVERCLRLLRLDVAVAGQL